MIWTFLSHLPWFWKKFEIEGRTILWNCNLFQELMNRFERYFIRIIRRMKENSKNIAASKRIRNWIWKKKRDTSIQSKWKLNLHKNIHPNVKTVHIYSKVLSQQKYWYFSRIFDNNMLHVAKLFRFCGKLFDKQCFLRAYFKDNLETSI